MLFMGAAFLPAIAETVDFSKLPAPEVITKHLSPIVMSQSYDGDGYIAESVGPVTVYQTVIGAGGSAPRRRSSTSARPGASLCRPRSLTHLTRIAVRARPPQVRTSRQSNPRVEPWRTRLGNRLNALE